MWSYRIDDIRDLYFIKWYNKKDFTVLEMMKNEFKREYYCRSAWFARDEEIEKIKAEIEELQQRIDKAAEMVHNIRRYSQVYTPIAEGCQKVLRVLKGRDETN